MILLGLTLGIVDETPLFLAAKLGWAWRNQNKQTFVFPFLGSFFAGL